jgi:hypothetical protein
VFNSEGMGRAETQELPQILATKFLALIDDARMLPDAICFYADGVKLTCEGHPCWRSSKRWSRRVCVW